MEKNDLKFISSIKGILCIVVLLHHLWLLLESECNGFLVPYINNHISNNLSEQINVFFNSSGRFAVLGFFVITGIGIRMAFKKTGTISPRSIFMRYIKLMYPILIVSMISYIFMKLKLFVCYFPDTSYFSEWALGHNSFIPNILDVIKISLCDLWKFNGTNAYVSFTWCMYAFLWGGYLCYAIAAITQNWKVLYKLFFFVILCIAFYNTDLLLFIIGFYIADIYCELDTISLNNKISNLISIPIIILLIILGNNCITNYILKEISVALIFSIIICNSHFYHKILSTKPLKYLGRISWNIYLLQYPILFTFSCFVFQFIYRRSGMFTAEVLTVILTILVVIALAIPFTYFTDYLNKKISAIFK